MTIEYKGWRLFTHVDRDGQNFARYEHYAENGTETKHLRCSAFLASFTPTQKRFEYLVDHDFPRAPKGNWYSHELDELIEKENYVADRDCSPS